MKLSNNGFHQRFKFAIKPTYPSPLPAREEPDIFPKLLVPFTIFMLVMLVSMCLLGGCHTGLPPRPPRLESVDFDYIRHRAYLSLKHQDGRLEHVELTWEDADKIAECFGSPRDP